jgi:glycosyltransferase involved in cell wall biosynthesis
MLTVDGLKKKGYEVTLLSGPTYGPEGEIVSQVKQRNLELVIYPYLRRNVNPVYDFLTFFFLISHIRKKKYDIVHTHSSKAGVLGRLAAYFSRGPIIVHTIHGLPFHPYQNKVVNFIYRWSEKIASWVTDKVISVADAMTEKAIDAGISSKYGFVTIRSGMELDRFLKIDKKFVLKKREELGLNKDNIVIGKVARLFPLKGHEYILSIAKNIIKAYPKVKFLFVGDGILREKFKKEIKLMGLEENFIFSGLVDNRSIPEWISVMDIVVHTSLREGLAKVIPQAMAEGKPVISFDIDGAKEVINPGVTGYLVPPENIEELEKKLKILLSDDDLRVKMGEKGREIVNPQFQAEVMVEQIEGVYQEMIRKSKVWSP